MKITDLTSKASSADNDLFVFGNIGTNTMRRISFSDLANSIKTKVLNGLIVNNLTTTATGKALDASQGKELDSKITVEDNKISDTREMLTDEYITNHTYSEGDMCIYNDRLWKCLVSNRIAPSEGANWTHVSISDELKPLLELKNSLEPVVLVEGVGFTKSENFNGTVTKIGKMLIVSGNVNRNAGARIEYTIVDFSRTGTAKATVEAPLGCYSSSPVYTGEAICNVNSSIVKVNIQNNNGDGRLNMVIPLS